MPWEKKGPADRTLIFDTFVTVGRHDPLFMGWSDVEMSTEDREVLAKLLGNLSSFGRAEGWVLAELLDGTVELPLGPSESRDPNPVPVLCPDPSTAFGDEHYPTLDPKKLANGKVNPSDFLFNCPRWHLCLDTETIHTKKWPTVPGTKWQTYTRPPEASATKPKPLHRQKPIIGRYALDAPVLPLVEDTLPLAEQVRRHLMGRYKRARQQREYGREIPPDAEEFVSTTFSGKDADGRPLAGHRHAFYLPTDEDGDGRLDHVTVVAEAGFDVDEVRALDWLRSLRWGEGEPLRLLLVGLGSARELRVPFLEESTVWVSATPFLATRYPKPRGRKRDPRELLQPSARLAFAGRVLAEELERLRQRRGALAPHPSARAPAAVELPEVVRIEALPEQALGARRVRPWAFQRGRRKPGDDGRRRAHGAFRIEFARPTPGPICLGHACHFGLGLFVPESSSPG
jgi:CRISPR-associated protein Csb2